MSGEKSIPDAVEEIWKKYDKDSNGYLDKSEMKVFIKDTMCELGEEFPEEIFESVFKMYDANHDEKISREEMIEFTR